MNRTTEREYRGFSADAEKGNAMKTEPVYVWAACSVSFTNEIVLFTTEDFAKQWILSLNDPAEWIIRKYPVCGG